MKQKIIFADKDCDAMKRYLRELHCKQVLLVHGHSMNQFKIGQFLNNLPQTMGIKVHRFNDYSVNPCIESAIKGAMFCKEQKCDLIIACGGGSAIDVAKCIRLFIECDMTKQNFWKNIVPGRLPFIAIPTTAGTGSEATHFAVVYVNGEKKSIAEKKNIPQAVVFTPEVLEKLPAKQKIATYLDSYCHCVESFWSKKSTTESRLYASEALRILNGAESYLWNDCEPVYYSPMLFAAHYAGCAINISETTAAHAMCYKLAGMFNIPHGQAAAICLVYLWEYMLEKIDNSNGSGNTELKKVFSSIADALGEKSAGEVIVKLRKILERGGCLPLGKKIEGDAAEILAQSVNIQRLNNHPTTLTYKDFLVIFGRMLKNEVDIK